MKKWALVLVSGLLSVGLTDTARSAGAAEDSAANYVAGALTNNANGGTGFAPWNIVFGPGGAVAQIADSTEATGDINSTNGLSFKFYGGIGASYVGAVRNFNGILLPDDEFRATLAYNWNGGNRGMDIRSTSGTTLANINYRGGDTLEYSFAGGDGVLLSTNYFADAVLDVVVRQLAGNQLRMEITRRNDGFTTNVTSGALTAPAGGVYFYNGGHAGDSSNYALYVNDLAIVPSITPVLNLNGIDAMPAGLTNLVTVTRGGSTAAVLVVALASDDPLVASVPANVTIPPGDASADFELEGVDLGTATITASALGFSNATFTVDVYDIAYDDSAYNAAWTTGSNGGLGFGDWTLVDNDGPDVTFTNYAGFFLGSSAGGSGDVNASDGNAFGMYANSDGAGTALAEALRGFAPLGIGESIAFEMGVNFRNGAKGADLWSGGGSNRLFEVAVYNDEYWYQIHSQGGAPVALGWAYASDSAIEVILSRHDATTYSLSLVRRGSAPESELINNIVLSEAPDTLRFYVSDTDGGGNENNLYFNRLAIYTGTIGSISPELAILGIDAMPASFTNEFLVARSGPLDDALTVNLSSSDPGVLTVGASVEIAIGESLASFNVVGVDLGSATITAQAVGFTNVTYDVAVYDIAYDDTAYYLTWDDASNGGRGYGAWSLTSNNGPDATFTNYAGFFLGDSAPANGDVNASDGFSFGMYANSDGDGDALAEAVRPLEQPLAVGTSLSFEMGINFRNGSKGVMIESGGTWLFEVAVFGDEYYYNIRDGGQDNPVALGWSYASDTVIEVILSRTGTSAYNVSIARRGSSPESATLLQGLSFSLVPDQVRFYVSETDGGGDENNLFFNRLAAYTGIVGEETTDGIPNSWWDLYSIPESNRVASANFDNDPASNLDEYIADTNPADILEFYSNEIEVVTTAGPSVTISSGVPTSPNRVYDVYFTENLLAVPQVWTPYGLNVPGSATGDPVGLTVSNDAPFRVYRTGVRLP